MQHLWAPWRSSYIRGETPRSTCIFCAAGRGPAEESLVLCHGRDNFVLLNRYPYSSGHLMIAPYRHAARLAEIDAEAAAEMMQLARQFEAILQEVYRPDGLNIGMNLGSAAGAGIEEHIHLHVLPRWAGDANFMTVVGDTRVMPEALEETYAKLKKQFAGES